MKLQQLFGKTIYICLQFSSQKCCHLVAMSLTLLVCSPCKYFPRTQNLLHVGWKYSVPPTLFTFCHPIPCWWKPARLQLLEKLPEAVAQTCSIKKVFLEISQNPQENTCARVSFLIKKLPQPAILFKKKLWHRCFPVNFAEFLRTFFYRTPPGDCFCQSKHRLVFLL